MWFDSYPDEKAHVSVAPLPTTGLGPAWHYSVPCPSAGACAGSGAGDGVPGNADTTDQDFALVVYNANGSVSTTPTIGVSPTSLSFTATVGGSNPANQTLSITNTGSGTLNWTASDNATWLTLAPTSGTAPFLSAIHDESDA